MRLGDVVRIKHGFAFSGMAETTDTSLPVVLGIGNFDYAGGFRLGSTTLKRYGGDYPKEYELKPGDVLLAMTCQTSGGEILGVPGVIPDDEDLHLHNQRLGKVEVLDPARVLLPFIFQLCRWSAFNRHLFDTASGSKILHTSPGRIEDFEFGLPPLEEQRTIAATLGALDDKIESNRHIVATTRELARSYFARFPKESVRASAVLRPILGGTPKRDEPELWDGNIPWASAKDIARSEGGFVLQTLESVTAAGVDSSATKVMPSGTVIITARGTVGALARLARPMAFNQSCYALQSDSVEPSVLLIALEAAVSRIQDSGHGSVFNTVNMSTFDHIQLDLPVVTDAEYTLRDLSSVVLQRLEEVARLTALRNALLPELLSGRIRVPIGGSDDASGDVTRSHLPTDWQAIDSTPNLGA